MTLPMTWHGIDLNWAYADLLSGIRRQTGCRHRAYDVLHDALIRLALVNERAPLREPQAYLRAIVRHALVDQFREASRWVELPDEEGPVSSAFDDASGFAPSAERLADLKQRLQAMQQILDCLPPRCREVFWLFRIEGYTYREIAASLGLTLRTVERQIARALLDIHAVRIELMA
ncbi:RNA polymerase sigma factor [Pollutimonas bauzanensis]|uniref:RNA polymerase sigma-70 factor, ECF subfamily n=1 Tax=Pollutimonas bauzanensis TaxID=658167 RepID=A0A1M5Y8J5_9BURK|nr:sigma-70 family RNA polymerase sigma factor [Pollutimonas bauzanensis]SHI08276.1 RNA polymerase sigma-70 factor, ECF subfamily [Pollutimonas bauzanensis]